MGLHAYQPPEVGLPPGEYRVVFTETFEPEVNHYPGWLSLLVCIGLAGGIWIAIIAGFRPALGLLDRIGHGQVTRGDILLMFSVSLLCSAILFGRALWKWVKG